MNDLKVGKYGPQLLKSMYLQDSSSTKISQTRALATIRVTLQIAAHVVHVAPHEVAQTVRLQREKYLHCDGKYLH